MYDTLPLNGFSERCTVLQSLKRRLDVAKGWKQYIKIRWDVKESQGQGCNASEARQYRVCPSTSRA